MRTCTVTLPLEPLRVGQAVDRAAWPAHVTLLGNARLADGATDTAAAVLRAFAASARPLEGVVGAEAAFGPDRSVRVDLVESPGLHAAHEGLLTAFEAVVEGFAPLLPAHSREGYRPHRTVTRGPRPAPGTRLVLDAVALVELDPPGMPGTAIVLAQWDLGRTVPADAAPALTEADVTTVLGALAARGAPAWVIGGWGVDALAGRRTRPHHDLDLLVPAPHVDAVRAALDGLGYRVRFLWSENRWCEEGGALRPSAFVAVDPAGREVDVHTVDLDGDRPVPVSASAVRLPRGALSATGRIGGEAVRCATAEAQLAMHAGYPLPPHQEADVALLRTLRR